MRRRLAAKLVRDRLRQFPAVGVIGPRQAGKTTLARTLSRHYYDLEQPGDRVRLDLAWETLPRAKGVVILDEAQAWPEVFARVRGAIDADRRRNGRFLLLGSVSPALMRQVSESLAGRLSLVELAPFCASELPDTADERLWRCGGFPDGGVLGGRRFPQWQLDYLTLMAQRDLPAWGLPAKPAVTERLFRMLAAQQGGVLNASHLGQSLGLSYHTVQTYLDYLQGAFLIRVLPPYHANIGKRLTKAPKVYWRDSGLLHALLGLSAKAELWSQPWAGQSWEGWVIEQILAARQARGETLQAYFFRTHDGWEADLVLEAGGAREALEIKLTTSPSPDDFARLEKVAAMVGATRQVLLSRTEQPVFSKTRWSVNLRAYLQRSARGRT